MATPDINKAYQWAINTCNDPNVGYSQTYRAQQTYNGITYYDCSSFIYYALKAGDFDVVGVYGPYPWTTYDMIPALLALGFTEYPVNSNWVAGDILWRGGHTEMVYQGVNGVGGITMGAHSGDPTPLADQVSINNYVSPYSSWQRLFRYGNGATGGYGSSLYVIAAICGNWYQESQINPGLWQFGVGAWSDLYNGYGLGQWTNQPNSPLLLDMHNWLVANGYADDSGDGQVAYFLDENRWLTTGTGSAWASIYPTLKDFLSSTDTNINDLTHAFMNCWEGLSDNSQWAYLADRQRFANDFYNYLSANYNLPVSQWYTSDTYITLDKSQNNSIMLYKLLSAGSGGGGNIQPDYNTLNIPVYMLFRKRKIIDIRR